MAKKNKPSKEREEGGAGSKVLTVLIILLIVFIWLAILALLIKFDVGGLGSRTLRPILKDIPVINRILPDVSDEQEAYENGYHFNSMEEMYEYVKKLESDVDKLREENDDYAARQLLLQQENDNLRHYEEEQDAFAKRVEEFDRNVVYNEKAPSTEEYLKWYEGMYAKNAAAIYEELMEEKQYDTKIKEKADYLSKMKPEEAAAILEEMSSDIDLICDLLYCMKQSLVSDILKSMEPLFAARIINRMVELDMDLLD